MRENDLVSSAYVYQADLIANKLLQLGGRVKFFGVDLQGDCLLS